MLNLEVIVDHLPLFVEGLWTTVQVVAVAVVCGLGLAVPLAVVRLWRLPVLGAASRAYSYALRGTPLLVQVYLLY